MLCCMERNWKSLYCLYIHIYIVLYIYIYTIPRILSPVPTQKKERMKCVVSCRVNNRERERERERNIGWKAMNEIEESTGCTILPEYNIDVLSFRGCVPVPPLEPNRNLYKYYHTHPSRWVPVP